MEICIEDQWRLSFLSLLKKSAVSFLDYIIVIYEIPGLCQG